VDAADPMAVARVDEGAVKVLVVPGEVVQVVQEVVQVVQEVVQVVQEVVQVVQEVVPRATCQREGVLRRCEPTVGRA
jgi:methyl-accepting chemotaxis protein